MSNLDNLVKTHTELLAKLDSYKDAVGRCYSDWTCMDNLYANNPGHELKIKRLKNKVERLGQQIVRIKAPEFFAAQQELKKQFFG